MSEHASGSTGPATDRHNDPVIDPTANVLALVDKAIERQDDLRKKDEVLVKTVLEERAHFNSEQRQHIREILDLRAAADQELRHAESKRIDAIRAVDVGAVAAAAAVQATQATTLAAQVSSSAEALRNQVAAAATAQTVALAAALEPIIKDIADLRRAQYEAQGQKSQVVESHAAGANVGLWVGLAFGAFSLILAAASMAFAVYIGTR